MLSARLREISNVQVRMFQWLAIFAATDWD